MTDRRWNIWIDRPAPPEVQIPHDVQLVDDVASADGAVIGADRHWDAHACLELPRLKVLARSGIGFDNVDAASCATVGVAACNAPDAPTVSTAEHTLALILAVAKKVDVAARNLKEGHAEYRSGHRATELDGLTLGLVGCGRIGGRVARYAAALGMDVIAFDPALSESQVDSFVELVDLPAVWDRSHVVSLHAPATETTRHMVNAATIATMRPGVIIVNCARGALIDHDALLEALEAGRVAGAGLDVTEPEPLPAGHPLLDRDDVIVTPHVASSTVVGVHRLIGQALEQAVCWLRGDTPEHLLDPAAADPAVDRREGATP